MRQLLSHRLSVAAMAIAVVALFLALNTPGSGSVAPGPAPAVKGVPSGAVMFFARRGCPSGWKPFISARGRYIVGVPSGGTLLGQDGTALSNLEDRPTGQHTHTINDPGHSHPVSWSLKAQLPFEGNSPGPPSYVTGQGFFAYQALAVTGSITTIPATTGITINPSGAVAGTNAPYVQLLACEKT